MESYERLLLNNKAFVQDKLNVREDYFSRMVEEQHPDFLWIGCSDSRVPPTRSPAPSPASCSCIAMWTLDHTTNMLSVLQYAVDVLGVHHVIVCGHYGCGGIKTALTRKDLGLINKWLRHIKDVYRIRLGVELVAINEDGKRFDRLVETQRDRTGQSPRRDLLRTKGLARNNAPRSTAGSTTFITGYLRELIKIEPGEYPDDIYQYKFDDEG